MGGLRSRRFPPACGISVSEAVRLPGSAASERKDIRGLLRLMHEDFEGGLC